MLRQTAHNAADKNAGQVLHLHLRELPGMGLAVTQAVTMGTEFFEQLRTEHDIAIFATLATLDTNHHALAIDVSDFQVC